MRVCIVLGTRPEVIKFTPVIEALKRNPNINLSVINTGQHTTLLDVLPLDYTETLVWQAQGNGGLSDTLASILVRLDTAIINLKPDLILVQGDTTSALCGALAAANYQIPLGHVEAGLRTYDKSSPFPEENIRRIISSVADYHFCISSTSIDNLEKENVGGKKYLTGSTAIDMVHRITRRGKELRKYILLTLHRKENLDTDRAANYLTAICRFLKEHNNPDNRITCLWVTHPNPKVQALVAGLTKPDNMGIIEPADYTRFIQYAQHAWVICSDSGGIQEENTVLQRPLFILRDTTERPEVLDSPNVVLVTHPDALYVWLHDLWIRPERYHNDGIHRDFNRVVSESEIFGTGNAGERIANIIGGLDANTGI